MSADDDALRDELRYELIADTAATLDDLLAQAEHERANEPDAATAQWLDALLTELRPIAEQVHDLAVTRSSSASPRGTDPARGPPRISRP